VLFGLVAELTSQTFYEPEYEPMHAQLAQELLRLATALALAGTSRAT
jgi:hypothetical protein